MKTKDRILVTALELFNEIGSQAATTNHIAKKMGISPGNLHYHYDNREEIILMLYIQMRDQLVLPVSELPKTIAELVEHQKLILTVSWEYRFFNKELLCLLTRDNKLNDLYIKDNIAHRSRIIQVIKNLVEHGELEINYENIIEYIADTILLTVQFWNPFMLTLGKTPNKETLQEGIERSNESMRPYLTQQALKTLAKLDS